MENDASRLPAASFVDACAALKQLCGDSVDWQWTDAPTAGPHQARRTGWLVLKQRLQLPCGALPEQGLETREADAAAAADDPGALSVSGASSPSHHWYSLCVVHNSVYCVPQLLFRGCTAEGSPLSWPAVLSDLARNSANQLLADSVSPWIHPVTGEVRACRMHAGFIEALCSRDCPCPSGVDDAPSVQHTLLPGPHARLRCATNADLGLPRGGLERVARPLHAGLVERCRGCCGGAATALGCRPRVEVMCASPRHCAHVNSLSSRLPSRGRLAPGPGAMRRVALHVAALLVLLLAGQAAGQVRPRSLGTCPGTP